MLKFLRRLALVLLAAIVLAGGAAFAAYHLLPTAPDSTDSNIDSALDKDDTYNILLCGVDEKHENADTIVIVSFDDKNKTVKLLSVPRDTMSNVDRTIQKINASYSVDHIGNIEQTIKEVEMVTAIPIDRYAITTFDGFEQAIDALGGVEMYVPQDLQYSDPYQDLEIDLKEGDQVLDGAHALQFVRYRAGYVEGDLGRIKAQQQFFKALAQTLLDPSNLTKVPAMAKIVSNEMETDLTIPEMMWFAKEAQGMDLDAVNMFVLPGTPEYVDDISYYIPSEEGIIDLINKEFNPSNRLITSKDLNLVDMAKFAIDTTNSDDEDDDQAQMIDDDGLQDETGGTGLYDTNGSYPASQSGGATYGGSGGYYTPGAETTTGQPARSYTTTTTPSLPDPSSGVTVVPSDSPSNNGSGQATGGNNTAPVE
jgi:LCP family protein required for cell wall assembly